MNKSISDELDEILNPKCSRDDCGIVHRVTPQVAKQAILNLIEREKMEAFEAGGEFTRKYIEATLKSKENK